MSRTGPFKDPNIRYRGTGIDPGKAHARAKRLAAELLARRGRAKDASLLTPDLHQLKALKHLMNEESRLAGDRPCPIPFHELLLESSYIYAKAWRLGEQLKIGTTPAFKSWIQMIREFDPFNKRVEYPSIKDELEWTLQNLELKESNERLIQLRVYNWSAFHELWHLILFNLLPCRDPELLTFYFIFIEAFVTIQEAILARELGPVLQDALVHSGTLNHAPVKEFGRLDAAPEDFAKLVFEHYFERIIQVIDDDGQKRWAPKYWVTEFWTGYQKFARYSGKLLRENLGNLERFEFKTFDPDRFRSDPDILIDFSRWYLRLVQ